jgi:hypothetical protein
MPRSLTANRPACRRMQAGSLAVRHPAGLLGQTGNRPRNTLNTRKRASAFPCHSVSFAGSQLTPTWKPRRKAGLRFASWRSLRLCERPTGYVYRLPTEAEWEYACRAGTTTRFSFGDDPGYSQLGNYVWYDANSGKQTHPVGQKQPNPRGLYDMHGNVWEWCLDWTGAYPGGSVTDPIGANSGSDRVVRGGCWSVVGRGCRSARRISDTPGIRFSGLGFRAVLAPGQP